MKKVTCFTREYIQVFYTFLNHRIMAGGMIDRQGLLHVGDVIKEINGKKFVQTRSVYFSVLFPAKINM